MARHVGCLVSFKGAMPPCPPVSSADLLARTWVVSPSERLETTEDGSAHVTDPTTTFPVVSVVDRLLSTWKSPSTTSTTTRRRLLLVRQMYGMDWFSLHNMRMQH